MSEGSAGAAPAAGLLEFARQAPQWQKLARTGEARQHGHLLYGLTGSQKPFLAAALFDYPSSGEPALYVTPDLTRAQAAKEDLQALVPAERVYLLPPREGFPHDIEARSPEVETERLQALEVLVHGTPGCLVVAPVAALLSCLPPVERWRQATFELAVGEELPPEKLAQRLANLGYSRESQVEAPGQFAVRGHVVDIFSATAQLPARVEYFGDTIDSIRTFDPGDQRSRDSCESLGVFLAREVILTPTEREQGLGELSWHLRQAAQRWRDQGKGHLARRVEGRLQSYREEAEKSFYFPGLENLLPLFFDDLSHPLALLPSRGCVFLDEPARLLEEANSIHNRLLESQADLMQEGRSFSFQLEAFLTPEQWLAAVNDRSFYAMALFQRRVPGLDFTHSTSPGGKEAPVFRGQEQMLVTEIRAWLSQGLAVVLAVGSGEKAELWRRHLQELELPPEWVLAPADGYPRRERVVLLPASLEEGFEFRDWQLVVLTEKNLVGQRKSRPQARAARSGGRGVRQLQELEPGDLVVHAQHGIGRYLGLETLEVAGAARDYLKVEYAGGDRLYVPTDQLGLLERYRGVAGQKPRLHRLGGAEWPKAKRKVRQSVQEMAQELLKLYAAREAAPGFAFSPDTVWQKEFEEQFPYQETSDQQAAIEAVKAAMEKPRPMDHLVCGDVGFGKTEVAIRAAFKAIMDGKQVTVVAPTTVLAQQHWQTFCQRFEEYPIRVEMLSRFTTGAKQREVLKELKRGTVDVVVGTHRLLQKDVEFRDLGLLVVDEEQRFGVRQKEILKRMREELDVLTLSATPIPRTLHMALAGLRDMSVIETPPEKRQPVQTFVLEHDPTLVREAIAQELRRGGQVFYVYNRVRGIRSEAARVQDQVPSARVAVAHGQMQERELEQVFSDFLAGEYDVLVCSTIIENGLDLPNVNTLIVNGADQMGLAQLYQLRGRVGRSERRAYAYFTYDPQKVLTEDAEKRLQALREFTELGSGFRLAMRDLEIRGAGELLGAEQHGHIASVGFEMYTRLLEDAVEEARGQKQPEVRDPSIDLNVSAYLPPELVPDPRQRIELYKCLAAAREESEIAEMEQEIRDRFGSLAEPARNLVQIARLRVWGRQAGVESVTEERGRVQLRWPQGQVPLQRLGQNWTGSTRRLLLDPSPRARGFALRTNDLEPAEKLDLALEVLESVAEPATGQVGQSS